jgi:hypothetical protein
MAESTRVKIRRYGVIHILDGAALDYTVAYEEGDLALNQPKREDVDIFDRDDIAGQRAGRQQHGTISFSVHMRELTNSVSATIVNVIEKTGVWVAATSTGSAAYEDFLHKVTYTVDSTLSGDASSHVATCSMVKLSWDFAEGNPNVINVTGKLYAAPTYTGAAA